MSNNLSKTILVVEDDLSLQKALINKFSGAGFTIIGAKNGEEGLKIALDKHPDLMIIDILMPVKDGILMMDDIRNDPWGRVAKIIVLTNYSSTDVLLKINKVYPNFYLIKASTSLEEILSKAEELLN